MQQHPHLSILYSKYTSETQAFRKVHRMIDWFESLIKTHTVVILAEYVRHNQLSDHAKALLAYKLHLPTLGVWKEISQTLFKELEKSNLVWTQHDFPKEFKKLMKDLGKYDVIELRNFYAHGATPEDEQCEKHIQEFEPFLHQLTQLKWLKQTSMIVREGKVYLVASDGELSLHPVLLFRKENSEASLAFFNDLKYEKVGLLNYPLSKYYREKDFYGEFQKNLPLNDWKRSSRERFEQQIDELTESFKGRKEELAKLMEFVTTKMKGYFSVLGNPGIGKSTLIAQLVIELREQTDLAHLKVIEYFIKRGTNGARPESLLTYLIQKTDNVFKEGKNIRPNNNDPWSMQETLFGKWREWSSQSQGRKLIFLIDGLDEGTDSDLLTYLPREKFENILIIYGSRPGGQQSVIDFIDTLPREHHHKINLKGLNKDDIRAMIYEVGNKYELERDSAWIDEVLKRSDGYPLYLKLLCDAIINGTIALNDVDTLPKGIHEQYRQILDRYGKDIRFGNATLQSLYSLAAAKDYLNIHQLGRINHLDEVSKVNVGGILMEILSKKENLKDAPSFQLFHESFREYLQKEKKDEVEEAQEQIIEFCGRWEEMEGSASQHYALQYYASHLKESRKSKRKNELLDLLNNKAYIQTQKQVLRQFNSTKTLFQLGLAEACKQKNWEVQLETALTLVDLKHEESNDVNAVIDMVANGEIDLALQRIESFGGQDKEGLKRKFILYMLCLAELTLLESKEKPFRKSAIEALLNHLDENIPDDTSIFSWVDFLPSYLIFLISLELKKLNIEYWIIFNRTSYLDLNWIQERGPFNDEQLDFLIEISNKLPNIMERIRVLYLLAIEFKKAGKQDVITKKIIENLIKINEIIYNRDLEYNNYIIAKIFAEIGKIEQALEIAEIIKNPDLKDEIIFLISIELFNKKKLEESLIIANNIFWFNIKHNLLHELALSSLSNDNIKKTFEIINKIKNKELKINAIKEISIKLFLSNKKEEFDFCIKNLKKIETTSKGIYIQAYISAQISTIHFFCSKNIESMKKIEEAINLAKKIKNNEETIKLTHKIVEELKKQNKYKKAIALAKEHSLHKLSDQILKEVTINLEKKGLYVRSLINLGKITHPYEKIETIYEFSLNLKLERNREKAKTIAIKLSKLVPKLIPFNKRFLLKVNIFLSIGEYKNVSNILVEILENKRNTITFSSNPEMPFFYFKSKFKFEDIINHYINLVETKRDPYSKIGLLIRLSEKLNEIGDKEKSIKFAEQALKVVNLNYLDYILFDFLEEISILYAKNDMTKLSLEIINKFKFQIFEKDDIFSQISLHFMRKNKFNDAYRFSKKISIPIERDKIILEIISTQTIMNELNQALKKINLINDKGKKILAIAKIATGFANQENENQSFKLITQIDQLTNEIPYVTEKILALVKVSQEFEMKNQIIKSQYFFSKAMGFMNDIKIENKKIDVLRDVFIEIASLKNIHSVENIFSKTPSIGERQNSFKNLAYRFMNNYGIQFSLEISDKLNFKESKTNYLKGWVKHVDSNKVNQDIAQKALPYFINDTESLEIILQKYALHETFLGNSTQEQLQRFNKTLNIQWALDIVASFPKDEGNADFSIN